MLRAYLSQQQLDDILPIVSAWDNAVVHPVTAVDDDWKERWKDFFHATRVGERFLVRPPWEPLGEEYANAGLIEIIIEPGMAFGTGTHETTQATLLGLETVVQKGDSVLDVGCGSGVLSIAAAKLGARRVLSIDIDPESVRATLENARINGVAEWISSSTLPLLQVDGTWSVVVANILSSILLTIADELVSHVAPGGDLLLSGILLNEADDVADIFCALGVTEVERHEATEWVCLRLRRN